MAVAIRLPPSIPTHAVLPSEDWTRILVYIAKAVWSVMTPKITPMMMLGERSAPCMADSRTTLYVTLSR